MKAFKILASLAIFALIWTLASAIQHGGVNYGGSDSNDAVQTLFLHDGDKGAGKIIGNNDEYIQNGTDGEWTLGVDESGATLGALGLLTQSTTPADADVINIDLKAEDDYSRSVLFGRQVLAIDDVSSNTMDATWKWYAQTAGSSATAPGLVASLNGTALTLGTSVGIVVPGTAGITGVATLSGGAKIGASGTTRTGLISGSVSFPNGATTASLTITGLTASHKLILSPSSAYSGAVYYKYAVPGTGAATVAFSGDPTTTVTMSYEAWTQ